MFKTNYHTHTDFCDGKEPVDSIVKTALQKGFTHLGFSSHSMYPFASNWHISPKEFQKYADTVNLAKEKYSGKIKIFLGFEGDFVPSLTKPDFSVYHRFNPDFLIGSVHYIFTEKGRLAVDYGADELKEKAQFLFNGNYKKMVQEYFRLEREMLESSRFTIIGHPDLVRKNNGKLNMFSEKDSWYRKEIKLLAEKISKADVIAEINTGAIARKTMDSPYPSLEFLTLLHEKSVPVTFSSDCHNMENLDCGWEKAMKLALEAGYTETAYLEGGRILFQKIKL